MQKQKRNKKKQGAHNVQCMYEVYIVIFNK